MPRWPERHVLERFMDKVDQTQSCWLWTGYCTPDGYGRFRVDASEMPLAHRVAYVLMVGPIPEGMTIDHVCYVRHCVNPDHLRPLSVSENTSLQRSATATHCVNGHEYTPENTYLRPSSPGGTSRDCRACIRARSSRAWYAKKEAARVS